MLVLYSCCASQQMEGASPAGLLEITPQAEQGNVTVLVVLFGRHLATLGFSKPMMETEAPGIYKETCCSTTLLCPHFHQLPAFIRFSHLDFKC